MGLEKNLVFLVGEKVVFFGNDLVFLVMVGSRNFGKDDCVKEEMVVVVDVVILVDEFELMVNLVFVKNDLYEKGLDLVVVYVYVKEICRDILRVFFCE